MLIRPSTLAAWLMLTTGIILGAAYMLYLYRRVVFGEIKSDEVRAMPDLSTRELWLLAPIAALRQSASIRFTCAGSV